MAKSEADEIVMSQVLANEMTAYAMAKYLEDRGCKCQIRVDDMTHEEQIEYCLAIILEIERRDRSPRARGVSG